MTKLLEEKRALQASKYFSHKNAEQGRAEKMISSEEKALILSM